MCLHSDEEELRKSFSELGDSLCDSTASRSMKRVGSHEQPLSEETLPSGTLLYKNGFLVRKVHADPDGKRSTSPRGGVDVGTGLSRLLGPPGLGASGRDDSFKEGKESQPLLFNENMFLIWNFQVHP